MQEPVTDHFAYGGQAVVEGVMMRGRRQMAVAVRAPSGEIVVWSDEVRSSRLAKRVGAKPFVRGGVLLWDTMTLGMRALVFSAAVGMLPRSEEDMAPRPARPPKAFGGGQPLWLGVAVSVLFAITIFFVLPLVVVAALDPYIASDFVSNLVEGLIRLGLLVGYMHGIGFLPEIRRVYAYHGAEHKAMHAWEAGAPLDVAHVRRFPLEHPRCGTAFLMVVMLLSLAVFMAMGRPDLPLRVASRIVLVPLVAGVAYELLKFGARHAAHPALRVIFGPIMKLQRLTTREPDDAMLDVAIAALLHVLAADGRLAATDPRLRASRLVGADLRPVQPRLGPLPDAFEPAAD